MTETKFVHSPIHVLPDLNKLRTATQNPGHPFYIGKVVQGRNAEKIARALSDNRRDKSKKK